MKKYNNFLLENKYSKFLKYYMFDWDDNILIMRTVIHVDHRINGEWIPEDVSTSEFRDVRPLIYKRRDGEDTDWRLRNDDASQAYSEFRDTGPRGKNAFYEDALKSIRTNDYGPVWDTFINCLVDGSIFLIITARGHEPNSIKKVVKWIINNKLTNVQKATMLKNLKNFNELFQVSGYEDWSNNQIIDYYLSFCDFMGINSKYFAKRYGDEYDPSRPEQGKEFGIRDFVKKINKFGKEVKRKVSVGFSDDDLSTVEHIQSFMRNELSLKYAIDYNLYHTSDGIEKLEI